MTIVVFKTRNDSIIERNVNRKRLHLYHVRRLIPRFLRNSPSRYTWSRYIETSLCKARTPR